MTLTPLVIVAPTGPAHSRRSFTMSPQRATLTLAERQSGVQRDMSGGISVKPSPGNATGDRRMLYWKKRGWISLISALAAAVACVSPCGLAAPIDDSHVSMEDFLARLRPFLKESNVGGRVYYRANCPKEGDFYTLTFPNVVLRSGQDKKAGDRSVEDILPKGAILERRAGIISIKLDRIPTDILDVKIGIVKFTPDEQFNETLAIDAIENSTGVKAATQRLGYDLPPVEDISIFPVSPEESEPHLPETLSNMTVDEALDQVAKTFGAAVLFGVCEDQHIYLANTG